MSLPGCQSAVHSSQSVDLEVLVVFDRQRRRLQVRSHVDRQGGG
jgi:hypothetical protein